ncbi:hypothetical protein H5392_13960 [Tessaracoccus sp. MC1865]|uniref:hypothetical protein n=1 Tax=Tessaracoccus sp. MC1865 TaxID=2760310 RepID=UPI00160392C1|nr:hypothetical protein [Tessaracoccus sp. MC1865]MBB1484962.1 hypothetical protein [Tessaracoccus sp. MC1865]QTO38691.1 hypothetical protein J7D54_06365 [Tessaracoccus sp. MC1865]
MTPAISHATPQPAAVVAATHQASTTFGGLTAPQWLEVANTARAAGDLQAAHAAGEAAGRADGIASRSWTAIAKKAIKAALTYGRPYLPKTIRPWADKIVKVIDQMSATTEYGITIFLVNQGLPVDVARATAQWIVFFLI